MRAKAAPLPDGRKNMNPADIGHWRLVAEDLRTHRGDGLVQGFRCLFWHRFVNWRMSVRFGPARCVGLRAPSETEAA